MRAKRLFADDGSEMRSAHLSCFAYEDQGAGIGLLLVALRLAASRGFPDLFVSIPFPDVEGFTEAYNHKISAVVVNLMFFSRNVSHIRN